MKKIFLALLDCMAILTSLNNNMSYCSNHNILQNEEQISNKYFDKSSNIDIVQNVINKLHKNNMSSDITIDKLIDAINNSASNTHKKKSKKIVKDNIKNNPKNSEQNTKKEKINKIPNNHLIYGLNIERLCHDYNEIIDDIKINEKQYTLEQIILIQEITNIILESKLNYTVSEEKIFDIFGINHDIKDMSNNEVKIALNKIDQINKLIASKAFGLNTKDELKNIGILTSIEQYTKMLYSKFIDELSNKLKQIKNLIKNNKNLLQSDEIKICEELLNNEKIFLYRMNDVDAYYDEYICPAHKTLSSILNNNNTLTDKRKKIIQDILNIINEIIEIVSRGNVPLTNTLSTNDEELLAIFDMYNNWLKNAKDYVYKISNCTHFYRLYIAPVYKKLSSILDDNNTLTNKQKEMIRNILDIIDKIITILKKHKLNNVNNFNINNITNNHQDNLDENFNNAQIINETQDNINNITNNEQDNLEENLNIDEIIMEKQNK